MGFRRGERDMGGRSYGWEKWLDKENNGWRDLIRKKEDIEGFFFKYIFYFFYYFSYGINGLW